MIAFNTLMAIVLVMRDRVFQLKEQGGGPRELADQGEHRCHDLADEHGQLLFLFGGVALALLGSGRIALSRGTGRWD